MNLLRNGVLGGSFIASLCSVALAEIKLPAFFSDQMVIQQESGANIWGWADAGQEVSVTFAGKTETAKADKQGKWKVTLSGLKASKKGGQMRISAGDDKKVLNDVLVGEVWIASGQSNMEWIVERSGSKAGAATAEDDLLRVYVTGNITSATELTDFKGKWRPTKAPHTMKFTAVGYEFAKVLREKLDVPVGVIECAWGGKPIEAFISDAAMKSLPEAEVLVKQKQDLVKGYDAQMAKQKFDRALAEWKVKDAQWQKVKKGKKPRKPSLQQSPELRSNLHSTIYNGMIAPIAGYSARGAIWYQGESNTKSITDTVYGELLEGLIEDWRARWGSNLSFYYVQLANYKSNRLPGWVNVQDEMRRLLDDADMQAGNIGMATINDIGAAKDIHPRNKKDVGARLARWALKKDYGMKDVIVSGPLYRSFEVKGNTVELSFAHAKGLKSRDGKTLGAFEIKSAKGEWLAAHAKIVGDKVVVSNESVVNPKGARYAWTDFPLGANLINGEGLPTSCFVTK